jgi:hypothetical protein
MTVQGSDKTTETGKRKKSVTACHTGDNGSCGCRSARPRDAASWTCWRTEGRTRCRRMASRLKSKNFDAINQITV